MEFRALLPRRRMVRHYRDEPVEREVVERIVETVRRAPSAGYSQGQRLLVVTEPDERAEIVRVWDDNPAPEEGLEPWIESAPVHVLVSRVRATTTTATGCRTSCRTARRSSGRFPTGSSTRAQR